MTAIQTVFSGCTHTCGDRSIASHAGWSRNITTMQTMVEAVFTPRESQGLQRIRAWAEGRWECRLLTPGGPREGKPLDAIAHTMAGDDFQGEYWGVSIGLPRRELEGELGLALKPGARLLGNFYKRSRDPEKSHDGSCWPADFAGGREYGLGSLAVFTVVDY